MTETFSLFKIATKDAMPFDAASYSRFKFGDGIFAKEFGSQLATAFIEAYKSLLLSDKEIVVVPSPYNSIPTASDSMADFFIATVNAFLYNHQKSALMVSKIHRYKTYSTDYGDLNYEERLNLISSDTYHIDKFFLHNRVCIFIDDIKITGSHEHIIRKLVANNNIDGECIFLYFAELVNKDIDPSIENYLNYYYVKGITEIVEIINKSDCFIFNTRTIKYLLKGDVKDVNTLIKNVSFKRLSELVVYAISNNYHLMDEYKNNLQLLTQHINYGY